MSTHITTTDIGLAAFYMLRGLELVGIERDPAVKHSMNCVFCFRDTEGVSEGLLLEWTNSQEQRFDNQLRALRSLIAQTRRSSKRRHGTVTGERRQVQ